MRIGLIGNMNNNNFSLMRYFRDLGADAHLLLYKDDGEGTLGHFLPECDTWEIEKWRPFIHRTSVPNAPVAALGWPAAHIMALWGWLRARHGAQGSWTAPVSMETIKETYAGYDCLVGSGTTPAVLGRTGRALDLFYPYAIGVEYLKTSEFSAHFADSGPLKRALYAQIMRRQVAGIQAAGKVVNFDAGLTRDVLVEIGVTPLQHAMPMVYNRGAGPNNAVSATVGDALRRAKGSDLSILHHARLMWSDEADDTDSKNNHWMLIALAKLIARRPGLDPVLLIVEYGPDVEKTRNLIAELNLSAYVHWLPKMERRELALLISEVSMVCGEFYRLPRVTWGGTGWEALAGGKPLLQGFNFQPGEFDRLFGYPAPPMLTVTAVDDIEGHLIEMIDQPRRRRQMGDDARDWFDRHNGIGLARTWLDVLHASQIPTDR